MLDVTERQQASTPAPEVETRGLTWLPAASVLAAAGLLLIAFGDFLARAADERAEAIFWIGLVMLVVPPAAGVVARGTPRNERLALVLLLGAGLFLIKLAWSPYAFTFPDELSHMANVNAILRTSHLFEANPVIPVTPLYPGLALETAALSSLTGLSVFQAGVLVTAFARLALMLALFLAAERIFRSDRLAAFAALLYLAHPNLLFYGAEFGYESVAIPLAAATLLMCLWRDQARDRAESVGVTLAAVLMLLTVVVMHHVTSYALILALWILVALRWRRAESRGRAPLDLAVIGLVAVLFWTAVVAQPTVAYLGYVFTGALRDFLRLLGTGATGRRLFESQSGSVTPLWLKVLGFGSQVLIGLGLLVSAREVWRRRASAVFVFLGGAAAAYIGVQALRLTSAGWETASRASEFLFFGVAVTITLGLLSTRGRIANLKLRAPLLAAYAAIAVLGGIVVGWPPDLLLPRPWLTQAEGRAVVPQGVAFGWWSARYLPPASVIAADQSNALALLVYGGQQPATGESAGVKAMLTTPIFDSTVTGTLDTVGAQYAAVDRRIASWDHLVGQFMPGGLTRNPHEADMFDPAAIAKFDEQPGVSRLYDGGTVVLYDTRRLLSAATPVD